ncbi:RING-H2 finger protein ATL70-like [Magnolia sinica]|uniref:RING-H2 finger protein ATL70-like n=1 Tax=Magnolia sinica TaxID=86752 RepID=UPI0026585243|nr:RING-H2 finger protein ATL70-like [Magnolia sinica]
MANSTPIKTDGSGTSDGFMDGDTMSKSGFSSSTICIILLIIATLSIASYFSIRACSSPSRPPRELGPTRHQPPKADNEVGLDDAILLNYPTLLYSHAKIHKKDTISSCCSICIAEYKDTDMLRLLPDCKHLFHVKCVDAWLQLHPTCPLCRMSPLPTPLAEVVPLASVV